MDEQQEDATPSPQEESTPGLFTPSEAAEARVGPQDGVPTPRALAHQQADSDTLTNASPAASSSSASVGGGGEPASRRGTAHEPNEDIAMERRVVPLLEYSEDICSICLDEYAAEDPGAPTVCG